MNSCASVSVYYDAASLVYSDSIRFRFLGQSWFNGEEEGYCLASRAPSTVSRYIREVRQFFNYQRNKGYLISLPCEVSHLALYLSSLIHKDTKNSAQMAYAALKWVHGFFPLLSNPLDSMLCKNLVEAEKRRLHSPILKKEPVDLEMINAIVSKYAHPESNLKDLRLATMCVLAFAGLLRSQELLEIKASHIFLVEDHLVIFLPSSKTDVYRQGQQVFIARSDLCTCPYNLLLRYLKLANIVVREDSQEYLFRSVIYLKSTSSYLLGKKQLSYTRCRELFKECLVTLGFDEKKYGLHSFRSGGATSLAHALTNSPSKERFLKLHGRWKSDQAKDMYIKESSKDRISISKMLGI